jgi:predicted Fe-S protein YdhL (DUF1289 family)
MTDTTTSPCIKECKLDSQGIYCTGCFRTVHEIAAWRWMTDEEKAMATALAETRKLAYKLDMSHDNKKPKRKARRVEPCNGHDSQG